LTGFWPVGQSAQGEYEQLRAAVLAGTPLVGVSASRFQRAGLAGLILAPAATVVFEAMMFGAVRPPWTPHDDPRLEALADAYSMVVEVADHGQTAHARSDMCMDIHAGEP
jgi:hypothetical protein